MLDIGFTGTRKGMTDNQKNALRVILTSVVDPMSFFRHGDEPHSDREAAQIADECGILVIVHPPVQQGTFYYLERNRAIVHSSQLLIAAPVTLIEERRSGTWYTIRYARRHKVPVILLDP